MTNVDVAASPDGADDLTRREWIALIATVCTAFSSQMTMPMWIAATIQQLHINDEIAGRVGALEYTSVGLVSLFIGALLTRLRIKQVMIFGMAILIAGNLASAFAGDAGTLTFARMTCGIGKGMVVAVSFGLLAGTRRPTRAFAIMNASYAAFAAFFYFVTPTMVGWDSASGIFLLMAAAVTLGACFLFWYPGDRLPVSRAITTSLGAVPAFGWIAVAVLVLLAVAHGAIWTFVARLGTHIGLVAAQIGMALSLAALLTIAGPMLARLIETRRGFALPMTVGVLLKAATGTTLIVTTSTLAYFVLTPSYQLLNFFIIPYAMGMMSAADPAGRLAGSASAGQQGGNAAGALFGGIIVSRIGFDGLAYFTGALFAIMALLVLLASPAASARVHQD